jgi:methylmalonyl-CoA mutase cobalamin-binding domain/chain
LGKNIIAGIYKACGYAVFDLGAQVSNAEFLRNVEEKEAQVLAVSAMMSTTMAAIPELIKKAKEIVPDTVIMVGGAPLDEVLAKKYGADGYAETAMTVIEETAAAIERVSKGIPWSALN